MGSVRAGGETGHAEVPAGGAALGLQCACGYADVATNQSQNHLCVMLSQDLCPSPGGGWDIQMWHELRCFSPALCSNTVHAGKGDWAVLRVTLL